MRAAFYEANGTARDVLRLGEVETPTARAGEVRVRLSTSGVNPSDVKSRAGIVMKMRYPRVIPHSDGAGVIDQVGEGVDPGRLGQRVWIWNGQWLRPQGSAADYIVLPAAQAVALPAHIGDEAGACLGIPAMTAWHAVHQDGPVAGKTLLIAGGAGAVGHYAIQMAKAGGATVLSTVSSAEKAALARQAGADAVIDYRNGDVAAAVQEHTGGRGVDTVIEVDLAANAALLPGVLAPKGRVVAYGTGQATATIPSFFCLLNSIRIDFFLVYMLDERQRAAAVAGITGLLEANALRHNIAASLPLAEIVTAHEMIEGGKALGNVVLRLAPAAAQGAAS
jgi:NADPH2:quinone reductase